MWSCVNEVIGSSKHKPLPVNDSVSWMSVRQLALMVYLLARYLKEIAKVIAPSLTTLYNKKVKSHLHGSNPILSQSIRRLH